jgi:dTDP-4-dehydrorhamnose 3,5-epimerase
MKITQLPIKGAFLIENFIAEDERGTFVKTFHSASFSEHNLQISFNESYYSSSKRGVIRGMHFQIPPHDHEKLVYVTNGEILDVILDLRPDSQTYGAYIDITLKEKSNSIYIPKGCAHGFLTISEQATVVYSVSTVYDQESDRGILWNSFGFDWLGISNPIISVRDQAFITLDNFKSPF